MPDLAKPHSVSCRWVTGLFPEMSQKVKNAGAENAGSKPWADIRACPNPLSFMVIAS